MAIRTIQHVPKKYKPFGFTASVDTTTGAGLSQTYDPNSGDYSPDHATHPVVFVAKYDIQFADISRTVEVTTAPSAEESSSKKAWWVDGKTLYEKSWIEGVDYELSEDGLTLRIFRNINPNTHESWEVKCRLRFQDKATKDYSFLDVIADDAMTSVSLAEAPWTLKLDSSVLEYNSESDDRTEYEYCIAHGITPPVNEVKSWVDSYLKRREVFVSKGDSGRYTTGFGYEIIAAKGEELVARLDPDGTGHIYDSLRFNSISHTEIWMNCQTITEGGTDYIIELLLPDGSKNGAKDVLTVRRTHPHKFKQEHENIAPVAADATAYELRAKITINGQVQDNPEAYLDIDHFVCDVTGSVIDADSVKYVGYGKTVTVNPQEEGVSDSSGLNQGLCVDFKKPRKAVAYSGAMLTMDGKVVLIAPHTFSLED